MPRLLLTLLLLISAQYVFAQESKTISGTIMDTAARKPLVNAVVALIAKDSSLHSFTRTDTEGKYRLPISSNNSYTLMISYPGYADLVHPLTPEELDSDLKFSLTERAKVLESIVVRSAGAIRIKGDTTEFVADSFIVREGATVEELLKKFPGFQVTSKGEIIAQGQRVNKVLVDGEEFFGDDPTAATQNISAKAVDKVQVYDTKNEQQQLRGITTGQDGKTVNIKLKEDQKKGWFGKLEGGSDFNNINNARFMYNRFVGKMKFSLFGTKSNTNTGTLNWEERRQLGIENDLEYDELGGYYYSINRDEFNTGSLQGLPDAYSAGALYINKWNGDKQGINASYRYNRLGTTNTTLRLEQNITPTDVFNTEDTTNSFGRNEQHAINGRWDWKLDSFASLKLVSQVIDKETSGNTFTSSVLTTEETDNITRTINNRGSFSNRKQFDNQLQHRQSFKKKDRLLLTTFRLGITKDDENAMLLNDVRFTSGGNLDSSILQDQMKINDGKSRTYGIKTVFSEPLGTRFNLVAEYGFNSNTSVSKFNTFDKSATGKYEDLNRILSSNFELNAQSNAANSYLRYNYKKIRAALGGGASFIRLKLFDMDSVKTRQYRFVNFTPQASFTFSPKPQSSIGFSYRGNTQQPNLNQLQPLRNNNDPLRIYIGNPDLAVGFNHNFNFYLNSYKMLAERGLWMGFGFSLLENAIVNSTTTTTTGRRITQPVNADGSYNWYSWNEWSKGEGEDQFIHSFELQGNGGRNVSFVNGKRNNIDYFTWEANYGLDREKEDKYEFSLEPSIGYNYSRSSLNPDIRNNYWSYGGNVEGYFMFPGKIELRTDADFNLQQRLPGFEGNPNIILWNAELYRRFGKKKNAKLGVYGYDMLNQNRGFTRSFSSDRLVQSSYTRLSQYFMIRFELSLNRMGGENAN